MAAGLSLKLGNVDVLRKQLNELATLTEDDLIPKVYIDARISISDINIKIAVTCSFMKCYDIDWTMSPG